jgi:hypothetical protein
MHRRHKSTLALDRLDGRGAREGHLHEKFVPDEFLAVAEELDSRLDGAGGEHAGVHEVPHGEDAVAPLGPQSSHRDVVLHLPNVQGGQLQLEVGVLHLPDLGHPLVELGLPALEGRVDPPPRAGFLALVTASARLALGGADAASDPTRFLDGAGIVAEVVEREEGDWVAERLLTL